MTQNCYAEIFENKMISIFLYRNGIKLEKKNDILAIRISLSKSVEKGKEQTATILLVKW